MVGRKTYVEDRAPHDAVDTSQDLPGQGRWRQLKKEIAQDGDAYEGAAQHDSRRKTIPHPAAGDRGKGSYGEKAHYEACKPGRVVQILLKK